jgi:putative selenium metabolism protein SsnA
MLLRNAVLVSLDPPRVEAGDLRIAGPRIVERAPQLAPLADEEVVDLGDRIVMPGLVNAHTHLYSSLARGMPSPDPPPRSFVQILERVWWRLDRALDEESLYVSGLCGAAEAALSGTTLLVDHHSSPGFLRGSLATLARATEEVGLRSVLCYEVTDRNGLEGARAGIEENIAFHRDRETDLTRGMMGGHASLTLSEQSMNWLAEAVRETGTSLHIHVAEDLADLDDCRDRYGLTLLERLDHHGLIVSRTILAHCVHMTEGEIGQINRQGGWIAHNPRSNMNNAVGHARAASMKRAALGTDGVDQDLFAEARACYLKLRDTGRGDAAEIAFGLLVGGHRLAAALFGLPFGKLDQGGPADLLVLDYAPPTPLTAASLPAHLLFGLSRSHVESVLVAGRWVVRDRRLQALDPRKLATRGRAAAIALWERMAEA